MMQRAQPENEKTRLSPEPQSASLAGSGSQAPENPLALRLRRERCERFVSAIAVLGDVLMILLGFVLAYWLRFESGIGFNVEAGADLWRYWPLLGMGSVFVFAGLAAKASYDLKDLHEPLAESAKFGLILTVGLFALIGISLAVRTSPPLSRMFVVCAWLCLLLTVSAWRLVLNWFLKRPSVAQCLRTRLVVVGGGSEAIRFKNALENSYVTSMVGCVQLEPAQKDQVNCGSGAELRRLGALPELGDILRRYAVDIAVLADNEQLDRSWVTQVANICEREHVQFKMVPHMFEILISGLRPSLVGGVPVVGVDHLPLKIPSNRILKRLVDIAGGTFGLIISLPLILVFGVIVLLESRGSIFYRQVRTGRNGRPFTIYKIRSMRTDAEEEGKAQWCIENDPRRLSVGVFMRRWNIDEVPQFWNVIKGDMSLVGPRPERPELIELFKYSVPHYQARHSCRPGLSGWAQVNGLRGNTSLEERIRYDIWYVENWSLILDFKIMFLTFFSRQNAY